MITELGIGNFKAFGEMQRVPIKPLTLIFGTNSSGKSSIIHSLLLAHHAQQTGQFDVHQTRLGGGMVDLGGFSSFVHRHDPEREMTLRLETEVDPKALRGCLHGHEEEKALFCELSRFTVALKLLNGQPSLHNINISIDGHPTITLSRVGTGNFRAQVSTPWSPFLLRAAKAMMRLSQLRNVSSKYPEVLSELLALGEKNGELEKVEFQEAMAERHAQDLKRRAEEAKLMQSFASGEAPSAEELVQFRKVFEEVMGEDEFSFDGMVLRDPRPYCFRDWRVLLC